MLENSSKDAFVGILKVFVWLAFLIYALKEKGLSYYEIQWQKCSLLSLLPLFFLPSSFFLSTATSTSACDCTPSPEVLLEFSLTSCSLNECFNALHNASFYLEIISDVGTESWMTNF